MFIGFICLLIAIILAAQSAYISCLGMLSLFPFSGYEIIYLIGSLEASKIIMAGVLQHDWHNKAFPKILKGFMILCVAILMFLTSLGVLGFLSKSNTESDAPKAQASLSLEQIQQRIDQVKNDKVSLESQRNQLESSINSLISNAKTSKESQTTEKYIYSQKKQRDALSKSIAADDAQINQLSDSMLPLKEQLNDVNAKLGPIRYISKMFGIENPNFAVNVVIILLMLVFDPFAVANMTFAVISFDHALQRRKERREKKEAEKLLKQEDVKSVLNTINEQSQDHDILKTESKLDMTNYSLKLEKDFAEIDRRKNDLFNHSKFVDILSEPKFKPESPIADEFVFTKYNDKEILNNEFSNVKSDSISETSEIITEPLIINEVAAEPIVEEISPVIKSEVQDIIKPESSVDDEQLLFDMLERKPDLLKNLIDAVKLELVNDTKKENLNSFPVESASDEEISLKKEQTGFSIKP